ncbi:hypothetical protein L5M37_02295 [Shewanella sp. SM69]|uniref:hypothetical protein n=1 Tax=Shewanella sp. SM69 TaxID=2912802 RepID=UPI0021D8A1BC|nr:hypothetical protein [Shewanella sp. SM69]MCU8037329.1 hypothetical protein [Shewanella sp. SM69]
MANLNVSFQRSINLIERHYKCHSKKINERGKEQTFSLEYFIHFYKILLIEEIRLIFDMDVDEFSSLTQTGKFQSEIINLLDKVIMLLANKALDARLYPPLRTYHKPKLDL